MNTNRYDLNWLTDALNKGEAIEYLFFWGHTAKPNETTGKFCFSQWYVSPFVVEGITYQTAEHWMMAQKALLFDDRAAFDRIIGAATPKEAKALGRGVNGFTEERWLAHRFDLVLEGNFHKFDQHPQHKDYLLSTGNAVIVEASPVDAIWGIGLPQDSPHASNPSQWRGLNLLGFALMEVRDRLRS